MITWSLRKVLSIDSKTINNRDALPEQHGNGKNGWTEAILYINDTIIIQSISFSYRHNNQWVLSQATENQLLQLSIIRASYTHPSSSIPSSPTKKRKRLAGASGNCQKNPTRTLTPRHSSGDQAKSTRNSRERDTQSFTVSRQELSITSC